MNVVMKGCEGVCEGGKFGDEGGDKGVDEGGGECECGGCKIVGCKNYVDCDGGKVEGLRHW